MRETRLSGSEGGARFNPLSLPLSNEGAGLMQPVALRSRRSPLTFGLKRLYWRA